MMKSLRSAGLYPVKTDRTPYSKFDLGRWMFDVHRLSGRQVFFFKSGSGLIITFP
jgi:hypothetical protein